MQEDDDDWEIEASVRLEAADYLHAWFYVPQFRTIWQYLLFMPFSFVLIVIGAPVPWRQWLSYAPWVVASIPLGALAAWAYRKHWAAASFLRCGPRQIIYRFDSEGMQVRSSFGSHRFAWDALFESVETPRAFLVFCGTSQFFLVPKRSFTAEQSADLAELLGTLPRRANRGQVLRAIVVWLLVCAAFLALFELLRSH